MKVKKTTKCEGKLKGLVFFDDELVDENGEVIDIMVYLRKLYGNDGSKTFDLSFTNSECELIDLDQIELDEDGVDEY